MNLLPFSLVLLRGRLPPVFTRRIRRFPIFTLKSPSIILTSFEGNNSNTDSRRLYNSSFIESSVSTLRNLGFTWILSLIGVKSVILREKFLWKIKTILHFRVSVWKSNTSTSKSFGYWTANIFTLHFLTCWMNALKPTIHIQFGFSVTLEESAKHSPTSWTQGTTSVLASHNIISFTLDVEGLDIFCM